MMISTGCKALDAILDGGVRINTLTNIFGESATGKTQFCFQLALNFARLNNNILFIDTLNNFRPERILEMQYYNDIKSNVLDNIYVYKPLGIRNILDIIDEIDARLIVIDDISELLLNIDTKSISKLVTFMHKLALKAIKYDLAVVITNRVTFTDNQKFDNLISRFMHYKIRFKRLNSLFSAEMLYPNEATVYFRISRKGLEDYYL